MDTFFLISESAGPFVFPPLTALCDCWDLQRFWDGLLAANAASMVVSRETPGGFLARVWMIYGMKVALARREMTEMQDDGNDKGHQVWGAGE